MTIELVKWSVVILVGFVAVCYGVWVMVGVGASAWYRQKRKHEGQQHGTH